MKKLLLALISLILVAFISFSSYWVVKNFETVKQTFNGTQIYVQTDVDAAYEDGYNTALEDASEFQALITEYRGTIADLNDVIAISTNQIDLLTAQKTALELSGQEKTAEITALNDAITALQQTVNNLNTQVLELQTQLQQTIDYYEGVLATIDFTNRATLTFMLDGAEYAIRSIELNAVGIVLTNPVSTSNYDFIGWTVDGVNLVDLSNYQITQDVTFNAVLNYKYQVTFMLDGTVYSAQTIYENNTATVTTPDNIVYSNINNRSGLYGYDFVGWTVDGVNLVDLSNYQITQDTTFTAVLNYKVQVLYWATYEDVTYPQYPIVDRVIQYVGETIDISSIESQAELLIPGTMLGYSYSNNPITLTDISSHVLSENTLIYVIFAKN